MGAQQTADDVFDLIRDLTQTLWNWNWEGVLGLESHVQQAAKAYGHEAQVVMSAEAAVVHMGARNPLLTGFPGIPPLAALPKLKGFMADITRGAVDPVEARRRLGEIRASRMWRPSG